MRARAIREGSVGLLILVGIGLFGGLVLWLRGLTPGSRNYQFTIAFANTSGMQVGTSVRYRGVPVGRVVEIQPGSNVVEVQVEITQSGLRIPQAVIVEANQSGFIGETTIDITPQQDLTEAQQAINPTAEDCQSEVIICEGDRLTGVIGVSYESLLRSTEQLADTLADPDLIVSLKATLDNAAALTERTIVLTDQLTELTATARTEIEPLSASVQEATRSATAAAQEIQITATDIRTLLDANRLNLTGTLANINRGSNRLAYVTDTLARELEDGQLLQNLRVLSANAAAASDNLRVASADVRQITGSVSQPETLLLIQQTLESARDVFQSAHKVLSDVDQLTGDPAFRNNIRDLINGLSDLLSSTQMLEQQAELALMLEPLQQQAATSAPAPTVPTANVDYQQWAQQLERLAAMADVRRQESEE